MRNFQLVGHLAQVPVVHKVDTEQPSDSRASLQVVANHPGLQRHIFEVTVRGFQAQIISEALELLKKDDGVSVDGQLCVHDGKLQLVSKPDGGVTFYPKNRR